MGTLKPGATYVYESPDGGDTVFAREVGKPDSEKILVGYRAGKSKYDELMNHNLWRDICELAKTNSTLKSEVERLIMVFELCKEQEPIQHHSV